MGQPPPAPQPPLPRSPARSRSAREPGEAALRPPGWAAGPRGGRAAAPRTPSGARLSTARRGARPGSAASACSPRSPTSPLLRRWGHAPRGGIAGGAAGPAGGRDQGRRGGRAQPGSGSRGSRSGGSVLGARRPRPELPPPAGMSVIIAAAVPVQRTEPMAGSHWADPERCQRSASVTRPPPAPAAGTGPRGSGREGSARRAGRPPRGAAAAAGQGREAPRAGGGPARRREAGDARKAGAGMGRRGPRGAGAGAVNHSVIQDQSHPLPAAARGQVPGAAPRSGQLLPAGFGLFDCICFPVFSVGRLGPGQSLREGKCLLAPPPRHPSSPVRGSPARVLVAWGRGVVATPVDAAGR